MVSGSDNGGTVYFRLDPGHAEITNCTFTNNTGRYGSGIFAKTTDVSKANSGLTITNCSFIGNQSTFAGGIFIDVLDAIVKDCTFKNNSALSQGGAIYSRGSTNTPQYTNCLLSGNRAENNGGGIYVNGGNPTFTNVTVAGNLAATNYGGGFRILAGTTTFNNSIINNNVGSTGSNCGSILTGASAVFNYSLIDESQIRLEGTGSFTNNNGLAGNPNFIDPLPPTTSNTPNQNGNYKLLNTSMCLDAGNNSLNSEIFDITELTGRKLDKTTGAAGIIDLGAYEYLETVQ